MLVFAVIALFAPALWHKRDVKNSQGRQKAYAAFAAEFLDSIQGLATLKAFGQSKARADKLEVEAHDLFRRTMWVLGTNVLARGITDSAIACGAAAALALGAWRVEAGAMPLASLLIILMLGVEIFRPMRELRTVLHQGMVGMSAAQGIYRILDDRPAGGGRAGGAARPSRSIPPSLSRPCASAIPARAAPSMTGSTSAPRSASASASSVPPAAANPRSCGCCCASTIPTPARIRLGGHDLRQLSFAQIRSLISVVSQDTFLFHGTVEDNIRMGRPEASTAEVEAAAKAANIHDFVQALPQGYQTVVGEKGIKLSGGQRQRVAIARALLRDTPILVLDEALSAVDAENEAVIQQALDQLMRGRTTLVLAHRLSSVIDCDRILVLDGGRVVESGKHDALMQAGGVYARLMAEQARESAAAVMIDAEPASATVERVADLPGGAVKAVTEGIIKAEGLGWLQLVAALMS